MSADASAHCYGKQPYDSPRAAARAKKALERRKQANRHRDLQPYRCKVCGRWHLGMPLRTSKQALRKLNERFARRHPQP